MPPPHQTIRPSMPSAGTISSNHRSTTSIGASTSSTISPVLLARLNEKKAELANLQELKALTAQLAGQMQTLEEKLGTLSDGAEAVALVLSNWHNVLRAIGMASSAVPQATEQTGAGQETSLPQTLVRIPVHEMDQIRAKDAGE